MTRLSGWLAPLLAAGTLALGAAPVAAQDDFPTKPVTIVVPYSAGASTDAVARMIEPKMSEILGQPVVVENRGGASGNVGTAYVADAEPDGYTLLLTVYPPLTMSPFMYEGLSYDPATDFAPIALLTKSIMALAVSSELPIESLDDLIAYVKEHPGEVEYGSAGIGSAHHIAGERLNEAAGLDMEHIPYPGGGPALQDLAGGHIEVSFGTLSAVTPHVESGSVRIIALVENERYGGMPDTPLVVETFPEIRRASWIGLLAPAGTPDEIIDTLNEAAVAALETPEVQEKLSALGIETIASTPEEFAQTMAEDLETNKEMVEKLGIEPE